MTLASEWQNSRADENLKAWILRKLGCDVISVELDSDQLDDAVMEAQEYWLQWVGRCRSVTLTLDGSGEYAASLLGTDVDSVVDVYFETTSNSLKDMYSWAGVELNPFQEAYEGGTGYFSIVQYMQYREDLLKNVSGDDDWEWDRSRRILIISPLNSSSSSVRVVYLSREFDYDFLSTYEWNLFRKSCLVNAMKTLSVIRTQFSEKPGTSGTFSMDGESLWANAEALEMAIEEKMRNMQRPTRIFTG